MTDDHKKLVEALRIDADDLDVDPENDVQELRRSAQLERDAVAAIESLSEQAERAEAAVAQLNLQLQIESESNMIVAGERDSLKAERDDAVAEAIERCAKVCDAIWDEFKGAGGRANTFGAGAVRGKAGCALELARAIRALKPDAGGKGKDE